MANNCNTLRVCKCCRTYVRECSAGNTPIAVKMLLNSWLFHQLVIMLRTKRSAESMEHCQTHVRTFACIHACIHKYVDARMYAHCTHAASDDRIFEIPDLSSWQCVYIYIYVWLFGVFLSFFYSCWSFWYEGDDVFKIKNITKASM